MLTGSVESWLFSTLNSSRCVHLARDPGISTKRLYLRQETIQRNILGLFGPISAYLRISEGEISSTGVKALEFARELELESNNPE